MREALVSIFGAPPVDGLGNAGGFKLMVEDRGNLGLGELQTAADDLVATRQRHARPGRRVHQPPGQHALDLPRHRPRQGQVDGRGRRRRVRHALQVYMGSLYVNNFNEFGRSWQVNVQADAAFRHTHRRRRCN